MYDEVTKRLVITGVELPATPDQLLQIEFAKSLCTLDAETMSSTNIECVLDHEPTCGDEVPILTSIHGRIPTVDGIMP